MSEVAGSPLVPVVPGVPLSTTTNTQSIADYLAQLLKDKKQLAAFPNVFLHVERLLDEGKQANQFGSVISYTSIERAKLAQCIDT